MIKTFEAFHKNPPKIIGPKYFWLTGSDVSNSFTVGYVDEDGNWIILGNDEEFTENEIVGLYKIVAEATPPSSSAHKTITNSNDFFEKD